MVPLASIYVTGSPEFTDEPAIAEVLGLLVHRFREAGEQPVLLTVGGPGAEATAEHWWRSKGLPVERLRLLERHNTRQAPYLLAHKAIRSDPDFVVIFGASKPALKALREAGRAGIPVIHIT